MLFFGIVLILRSLHNFYTVPTVLLQFVKA